jgi:hypothetical protein
MSKTAKRASGVEIVLLMRHLAVVSLAVGVLSDVTGIIKTAVAAKNRRLGKCDEFWSSGAGWRKQCGHR